MIARATLPLFAATLLAVPAAAQASYVEHFDSNGTTIGCEKGPSALTAAGWIFRDASSPGNCEAWVDGDTSIYPPQAGAGWLAADPEVPAPYDLAIWAIVPPVPDQVAGDPISIWVRGPDQSSPDSCHLDVRYSPSGGTNTGVGFGTGDFTERLVLVTQNIIHEDEWLEYTGTVPGTGRLALRVFGTHGETLDPVIAVDTFRVGQAPPPPPTCAPALPPLPQPGESVTWTAAGGPYLFCDPAAIPAGSAVQVEPGVEVSFADGATLDLFGTLVAVGTAAQPVTLEALTGGSTAGRIATYGTLELHHADVRCPLTYPAGGATIALEDSVVRADLNGAVGYAPPASYVWTHPPTITVERCDVIGDGTGNYDFMLEHCHALLRDVDVSGCRVYLDGYPLLERVTVTDSPAAGIHLGGFVQRVYLDDLTVLNSVGPALSLPAAVGALLGANNLLQGCAYPVEANSLMTGSVVPASGNARNAVLAGAQAHTETLDTRHWPELGVPWEWNAPNYGIGKTFIDPGVTVQLHPGMFMIEQSRLQAEGTPEQPIRFTRQDPADPWISIQSIASRGSHYEHCVFEGASYAGSASNRGALAVFSTVVSVDSCRFEDNLRSLHAGSGTVEVRDTAFVNSGEVDLAVPSGTALALLNAPDAPNSFDAEGAAITFDGPFVNAADARSCWWGDPSGPSAPQNPGGQGAAVVGTGASQVQVLPYLEAPPDASNHPPLVRFPLESRSFYAPRVRTGDRLVVSWTVADDDTLVEQRVQFSSESTASTAFSDLAVLPPGQRSYLLTVPDVESGESPSWVRVVAVDSLGQRGHDDLPLAIPAGELALETELTISYAGQTFRCGEDLPEITYTVPPGAVGVSAGFSIVLDAHETSRPLGSSFATLGSWSFTELPFVSTDTARLRMTLSSSGEERQLMSGTFSIRPDARLGDAPPSVTLLAPTAGTFPLGASVEVAWKASDDEGLHGFLLQASYDEGSSWHAIARDLPPGARTFQWSLPPGSGTLDALVRVVAFDRRLQSTSSTWNGGVGIEPRAVSGPGTVTTP